MLYTEVSYTIHNENGLYKAGTIGLTHDRSLNNSAIKKFLRKSLDKDQKTFKIDVIINEPMSEEVALQRYGNKLVDIVRRKRFR